MNGKVKFQESNLLTIKFLLSILKKKDIEVTAAIHRIIMKKLDNVGSVKSIIWNRIVLMPFTLIELENEPM